MATSLTGAMDSLALSPAYLQNWLRWQSPPVAHDIDDHVEEEYSEVDVTGGSINGRNDVVQAVLPVFPGLFQGKYGSHHASVASEGTRGASNGNAHGAASLMASGTAQMNFRSDGGVTLEAGQVLHLARMS